MNNNTPGIMKTEGEIRQRLGQLKSSFDDGAEKLSKEAPHLRRICSMNLQITAIEIETLEWVLGLK